MRAEQLLVKYKNFVISVAQDIKAINLKTNKMAIFPGRADKAYFKDGLLYFGDYFGNIGLYDFNKIKEPIVYNSFNTEVKALTVGGDKLVVATDQQQFWLCDAQTLKPEYPIDVPFHITEFFLV